MDELEFHYIKSPHHMEIKVDGALGGATPTAGSLAVSVFTERSPIPRKVIHRMNPVDGRRTSLGEELVEKRDSHSGVVRVVQATLHMDLNQARAFAEWLQEQINELESAEPE